jgi:subfamily B ATP-binding cassette protein MsbA
MISSLIRFRKFLRKYWGTLALGAIFTLASALFALAQPWPLKVIIDNVLRGKPIHVPGGGFLVGRSKGAILDAAIAAYLLIIVLGAIFDYFGSLLMDSTGERLVTDIRSAVFSRLQRLSLRFHSSQRAGDLVSRVMSDIDRLDDMLVQSFSVLLPNVALLGGMLAVMFLVDVPLALASLVVSPFLFLSMYRYTTRIKGASRRARKKEGLLAARTGEVIGAIRVVQAFTGEQREDQRFSEESSETLAANLEAVRLQSQFSPLIDILAGLGVGLVLFIGTRQVLSGTLTLGLLLVFLSYVGSFYRPMRQLSKLSIMTSRGVASAERVSEVLEAEIDVKDLPGAKPLPSIKGRVEFSGVHLSYGGPPALRGISLVAEPGEIIALVGPTGAGKTSLVSLIPRFLDPDKGRVLIDGTDIRSVQLHSLRSSVALVLQEPILFEGTIFDNIAYGKPQASREEVIAAAEAALVGDIVNRLPDGYQTRVGERGATLSGGERQRISIARALVRDAPILILDEPTSGLDPQSELLLMEALGRLIAGRTTFVIAHRMSTVRRANRVVVLDHGQIAEQGTHEELVELKNGMYRSFLELQVGAQARAPIDRSPPRLAAIAAAEARGKDNGADGACHSRAQDALSLGPGDETRRGNPSLFVVGCPWSGTTLVRSVLASHPAVAMVSDTQWIGSWFHSLRERPPERRGIRDAPSGLPDTSQFLEWGISRKTVERLIGADDPPSYRRFVSGLFGLLGMSRGRPLVGDETPGHVLSIPRLHELWPSARFVHVIRDGRAVYLSARKLIKVDRMALDFSTWKEDPVSTLALWWEWHVRLGRETGTRLSDSLYYEIRYEDLVYDSRSTCAELCRFLGIPAGEEFLRLVVDWAGPSRGSGQAPWPSDSPQIDWRSGMAAPDIDRFEAAAGEALEEFGYGRAIGSPRQVSIDGALRLRDRFVADLRSLHHRVPEAWADPLRTGG